MFDGEIMCRGTRKTSLHKFKVALIGKFEEGEVLKYYKCKHCGEVKREDRLSSRAWKYCVKY